MLSFLLHTPLIAAKIPAVLPFTNNKLSFELYNRCAFFFISNNMPSELCRLSKPSISVISNLLNASPPLYIVSFLLAPGICIGTKSELVYSINLSNKSLYLLIQQPLLVKPSTLLLKRLHY